jgi:hypothetical protein
VRRACPDTFPLCPQSADHEGFSIVDRVTGSETAARSEAQARQIAERLYPDCAFALSTIASTHPSIDLPTGVPDAVVVAILRRLEGQRFAVVAYVVSSVAGASCIPFSQAVWPNIKDNLPHDRRRSFKAAP